MMALIVLIALCSAVSAYPTVYYPYYNFDSVSMGGGSGNVPNTMVMSGYYQPYMPPQSPYFEGSGAAAFSGKQAPLYTAERGPIKTMCPACQERQQHEHQDVQENVIPIGQPEPIDQTKEATTELPETTDEVIYTTTEGTATAIEIVEVEKATPASVVPTKTRVGKKKVLSKPVEAEEEVKDENDDEPAYAKVPHAFFPMYFGSGRSAGGPGGVTAIANAYSTGKGGVATSHATAYGMGRPEETRHV